MAVVPFRRGVLKCCGERASRIAWSLNACGLTTATRRRALSGLKHQKEKRSMGHFPGLAKDVELVAFSTEMKRRATRRIGQQDEAQRLY
jgi:hypothetical protein